MGVGDKVYLYSGDAREIKGLKFEHLDSPIKVYNFEVEDWHTYFVSEQDVFVHNTCKAGDKTPRNREFTNHGAERANERGFVPDVIDSVIDNNKRNRVKEISSIDGSVTWRYQDN